MFSTQTNTYKKLERFVEKLKTVENLSITRLITEKLQEPLLIVINRKKYPADHWYIGRNQNLFFIFNIHLNLILFFQNTKVFVRILRWDFPFHAETLADRPSQ